MQVRRIASIAIGSLLVASLAAAGQKPTPQLELVATYDTGLGVNGAEIISVRHTDGIAAITNIAGSVDVLDLSNPFQPQLLRRVAVDTTTGTPNSVAVHPQHDYFLVVTGTAGTTGSVAAHRLSDGAFLASAQVGIQPDSIAIAPNGQYAVVANEAEGTATGNGGDGSLSIVDLTGFNGVQPGVLQVTNVALPSAAGVVGFSLQRTDAIAILPVDNNPGTLEPETVAFSENSRFAYITLQENSGVVRLDMHTLELTFLGLGQTTHDADLVNGGGYNPGNNNLTAYREPDGIALDQTGRFFVTADEGDTLTATGSSGPRGGRTVSAFDADTGALLGDTDRQLDDAAAAAGIYPDNRSNRGGSEPEVLDLTHHRGWTLVAVGLERANAVALIDLSDPAAPAVIDLAAVGSRPEGIKFFRRGQQLFVASANEESGTVSILEVVF